MIRCVAIDDEPIALSIIKEYCRRKGDMAIECFTSPIAGMDFINVYHPDIVFLDIEMNSHNGIEMARNMPKGVCLIFTTAYADYALEGFNVDAVDFLHKPIFYPRFERAIEKAKLYLERYSEIYRAESKIITLREGYKNVVVELDDVILIEAMDNYVKIYRKNNSTIVPQITMKEMESMLPQERFLRVHRSYIVSVSAIEKYSNRTIYLHNYASPIPVGRKFVDQLNNLNNLIHPS